MENTKLDMQALFSPNGVAAPFAKTQGKSPVASLHTQSTSFVSVLDEKTTEAINNQSDTEANNEKPDQEVMNPAFAAIPKLDPIQPGRAHRLGENASLSGIEDMKSMSANMKSVALSTLPVKTKGYLKGDTDKTAMPGPAEMTNQANSILPKDPVAGMGTSSLMGISELLQSESRDDTSVAEALGIKKQIHQIVTQPADESGQTNNIFENSTIFKLSSSSATEEKAGREMDQSTPIPTVGYPGMRAKTNVKPDIPFILENRGQIDETQTHTIVSESGPKPLAAAAADIRSSQMDSSAGDHAANHIQSKKSLPKTGAESTNQVSEVPQQKDDKSVVDSIFSDLHRTNSLHRDNRTDKASQKEAGVLPAATQEPIDTVNDRAVASEVSQSRKTAQVELSDHAVFMKSSPEGTTAGDQDIQQRLNVAPDRHDKTKNQYEFSLRAETTNIPSGSGNRLAASDGSVGINTQSVIDQIQNARQSMNSGFGRVRITLDPPNLGTVSLEIVVRKEWVGVVMTADNAGVQQALQSRVDDIRAALQRQDMKIENFQILLQDNTANQQQGYSGATFGQQHEREARQNQMENLIHIEPLIQPMEESQRAMGLVSIFV